MSKQKYLSGGNECVVRWKLAMSRRKGSPLSTNAVESEQALPTRDMPCWHPSQVEKRFVSQKGFNFCKLSESFEDTPPISTKSTFAWLNPHENQTLSQSQWGLYVFLVRNLLQAKNRIFWFLILTKSPRKSALSASSRPSKHAPETILWFSSKFSTETSLKA